VLHIQGKFEHTNVIRSVNRRTDNTVAKRKKTKEKRMIYETLHRKLKIQQHETHENHM